MGRIVAIVTAFSLSSVSPAIAFPVTAKDLEQQCSKNTALCFGYLLGILDGHLSWRTTTAAYKRLYPPSGEEMNDPVLRWSLPHYCLPSKVTVSQIQQITMNYLKQHPDMLDGHAERLINEALNSAFPCRR
jgi:hypothetical protein